MDTKLLFDLWMRKATDDPDLTPELAGLKETGDDAGIEDRFYRPLAFGTGRLRGVIGAGTNRMNRYTVRPATPGLSNYLPGSGRVQRGAAA